MAPGEAGPDFQRITSLPGMQTERHLTWDGCANVRDLGGHPTPYGETRWGAIVRADAIKRLTDAGWEELVGHGISTIVDLRMDEERKADPPADVPVTVVHVNVLGGSPPDYEQQLDALVDPLDTAAEKTTAVYLDFLERFGPNWAAAVRAVAEAPPGGVLVHCHGGKDRTGLVVALLLSLAGVSDDDIAADYAISERNLTSVQRVWEDDAETDEERERRRQIGRTPPEAMRAVLAQLERRHGSVRGFLLDAGATPDELDRAVARLR
jgi:protein-tyrosine phosphatase